MTTTNDLPSIEEISSVLLKLSIYINPNDLKYHMSTTKSADLYYITDDNLCFIITPNYFIHNRILNNLSVSDFTNTESFVNTYNNKSRFITNSFMAKKLNFLKGLLSYGIFFRKEDIYYLSNEDEVFFKKGDYLIQLTVDYYLSNIAYTNSININRVIKLLQ